MIDRARAALVQAIYGIVPARAPGQGLTEYGLILALAAVVVIVAIAVFASRTNSLIGRTVSSMS